MSREVHWQTHICSSSCHWTDDRSEVFQVGVGHHCVLMVHGAGKTEQVTAVSRAFGAPGSGGMLGGLCKLLFLTDTPHPHLLWTLSLSTSGFTWHMQARWCNCSQALSPVPSLRPQECGSAKITSLSWVFMVVI